MVYNFNYYSPTEIVFGKDTLKEVGRCIKKYSGTKVLVVYGSKRVKEKGLLDEICAILNQENIQYQCLGGVVPNPLLSKVREGICLGEKMQADFLLAVGGGSVIDTAKAIAMGLAEKGQDIWDLYENKREAKACLPVGSILTIAAAGSESSSASVLTNDETKEKRGYESDLCRPKFAIMNPEWMYSLPDYQTQSGCVDIMMHTMERYFTSGGNMALTDALAEGIMRTVMKNSIILRNDPLNYDARAEIMWAGSLSHNNLTSCGNAGSDFSSHMLEHELGGMYNVTHGAGLAAIWPSWARYVYKEITPRFVQFAVNVMGIAPNGSDEEIALKGIEAMEQFYHSIGMPTTLSELGLHPSEEECRLLAKKCARACGGSHGSAKVLHEDDMYCIYQNAL